MKLLQRTGRYYVIFSTLIFILWAAGLFFALKFVLSRETDERLRDARMALNIQLSEMEKIPSSIIVLDNVIEIQPIPKYSVFETFSDTLIWNAMEVEHKMSFRKFSYHDEINGKAYRISLNHSILDTEEMLTTIALTAFGILALLLFTINIFNRYLSLNIWKPFYRTVGQIEDFNFDQDKPMPSKSSVIDEFSTLQQALHQMTSKALKDYQSLKQFTENASHEIQNPLAIIKSKIELLMQQDDLNEKEQKAILQIQKAASRLSRLNQSLLLLTRIENRQFTKLKNLDLKELIENQIDAMEPMISSRQLTVQAQLEQVQQKMDPTLAEVLISNLLGNAIKHNHQEGQIDILLTSNQLQISNSGSPLEVSADKMFDRFNKGTEGAPSLGLGLAIVLEICNIYNFDVQYENKEQIHSVSVSF